MLIVPLILAVVMQEGELGQPSPPTQTEAYADPGFAAPTADARFAAAPPQLQAPYSSPPATVDCPTCPAQSPMFSIAPPVLPTLAPSPVATIGAPAAAVVAPTPYTYAYPWAPYYGYPLVAVTPYSYARYPIYSYPHLPHRFNDLRVRTKWHMSPGNMFPQVSYPPAAHGYYYFKPYNYSMVPFQQHASQRWGQPLSQPYMGPLQNDLAARAASYQAALAGGLQDAPGPLYSPVAAPMAVQFPTPSDSPDAASSHFRQQQVIGNPYPGFR
jgi:hypothetical protein